MVGFIFIVIGELILLDAIIPENIKGTPTSGKASKLLNFEAFVMLCRTLLQKRICFFPSNIQYLLHRVKSHKCS